MVIRGYFLTIISPFLIIGGLCFAIINLYDVATQQFAYNKVLMDGIRCATKKNGQQENKIYALENGKVFPEETKTPEVCKTFYRAMCWTINCKDKRQIERCNAEDICKGLRQ